MPLNAEKPRIRNPLVAKIRDTFFQTLDFIFAFIRPESILGIFLIVAVLLAFLQITAIGFYVVFGVFLIGYFAERIMKYGKTKRE